MAEELTRAYLKGIMLHGFFHADPHPCNVFLVMPGTVNPLTPRDMSPRRLYQIAMESSDLLAALPHRLDQITAHLANSDLATHVDVPQLPSLIVALQKVANHIFSGLVLAGLLAASVILMPYWPRLGLTGFVIAEVIALYMVFTIFVSDSHRDGR